MLLTSAESIWRFSSSSKMFELIARLRSMSIRRRALRMMYLQVCVSMLRNESPGHRVRGIQRRAANALHGMRISGRTRALSPQAQTRSNLLASAEALRQRKFTIRVVGGVSPQIRREIE